MSMTSPMQQPAGKRQSWNALESHYQKVSKTHLRDLFKEDPKRGERMTVEGVGLYLDYSKNRIRDEKVKLLIGSAEESGLQSRIEAMFRGEKINLNENRDMLKESMPTP